MKTITNGNKKSVVLLVAKNFLKYHPKSGDQTKFEDKIRSGEKLHTIRSNFKEWEKKIRSIEEGNSKLLIKQWSGVPYRSPQVRLFEFEDGIGIQKLEVKEGKFIVDEKTEVSIEELADKDGLTVQEFKDWFQVFPTKPMAIIHFSNFRY